MKYYYISRNHMIDSNTIVVYDAFDVEVNLIAYRTGQGKEDAIQYIGDFIPNDLIYDEENDVVFSEADRPSPYHVFIKGIWIIKDQEGYKKFCHDEIDRIKAEILEYGFDYLVDDVPHRQRCRDKDIAFMGTSMVYLMGEQLIGNTTATTPWYFEDNYEWQVGLQKLVVFARYGKTFMESVYKAENYFKTLEEPKFITKFEFENKRKEIHRQLVGA